MYAKLFARITESSLMEEPVDVRYVFVMLLAICDSTGHVIGTDIAIARRINLPVAEFVRCAEALLAPDPHSNSKEEEGRRIVHSQQERGYRVVNYLTYRDMKTVEQRREYMKNYMKQRRDAQRVKQPVNTRKLPLAQLGHAEAEVDAEGKANAEALSCASKSRCESLPEIPEVIRNDIFTAKWAEFVQHRRQMGKKLTPLAARNLLNRLAERPGQAVSAIDQCITRSWQAFQWEWIDKDAPPPKNGKHSISENIKVPIWDPMANESRA